MSLAACVPLLQSAPGGFVPPTDKQPLARRVFSDTPGRWSRTERRPAVVRRSAAILSEFRPRV
jgi:hypothetical protein